MYRIFFFPFVFFSRYTKQWLLCITLSYMCITAHVPLSSPSFLPPLAYPLSPPTWTPSAFLYVCTQTYINLDSACKKGREAGINTVKVLVQNQTVVQCNQIENTEINPNAYG